MNLRTQIFLFSVLLNCSFAFADSLIVVFPENGDLQFSVPIENGSGKRDYDASLEYPIEFNDGQVIKTERADLGFFIQVEVIEKSEGMVRFKIKIDDRRLVDWVVYSEKKEIIRMPVFSSTSLDKELNLQVGKWVKIRSGLVKDGQPLEFRFMYEGASLVNDE